jgi:ATP-binding cassette, subfamily F, member 3
MSEKIQHNIESVAERSNIAPEVVTTLERHIAELPIGKTGRNELCQGMGGATYGIKEVSITRTDPPIEIGSAVIQPGTSKVLIGPNGAGKSTIFDAIMERDDAHMDDRMGRGAITVGKPIHIREHCRVSRLDQEELLGSMGGSSTKHIVAQAVEHFKSAFPVDWNTSDYEDSVQNQEAQDRIDELSKNIVKFFEMENFLERSVEELSGGERTKLALFMVLASEPDLLLFDEPTNHLDLGSIAKLSALFEKYQSAGVGIVSASHVSWFLEEVSKDGVFEIQWNQDGRRLVESNTSYEKYVKNPNREQPPIIDGDIKWLQEAYSYKQGTEVINVPLEKFSISDSPLTQVSMPNITGGELVVISGNNGTGKTKLLETIVGNKGQDTPCLGEGVRAAYLPQFWPEEVTKGTVEDFFDWIKEGASPRSTGSAIHPEKPPKKCFVELIKSLHFGGTSRIGESWLKRPLSKFSGGEQRLLWLIAVSSLRDVDVLVLDEPTNHMDSTLQEKVASAMQSFPGAVILSTHDRTLLSALTDRTSSNNRTPTHIILTRTGDTTEITKSSEDPTKYVDRIMGEARQEAKKFKI